MSNINYTKPNKLEDFSVWCSKKFPLWCKSNFPFIEDTFEALDTYGLICKIVQYLNETKQNLNTTEDNVQNIYDFVTNYFDNLNLQKEVNIKIDELVKSGEIQSILNKQYEEIKEDINIKLNNQNTKISNLESKINVTGSSPIPVDSISKMTDISKIYLLTTDGYYYFYNGSEWVQGGKYQSIYIGLNEIQNSQIKRKDIYFENNKFVNDLLFLAVEVKENKKCSGYNTNTFIPEFTDNENYISFIFNLIDLEQYKEQNLKFGFNNIETYSCYVYYTENEKAFNGNSTGISDSNNNANYNSQYEKLCLCIPKNDCYYYTQNDLYNSNNAIYDIGQNIKINDKNINNKISINNIDIKKIDLLKYKGVEILHNRILTGYSTTSNEITTSFRENYTTVIINKDIFTEFSKLRDIKMKVSDEISSAQQLIVGNNNTFSGFTFQKNVINSVLSNYYDNENNVLNWGEFIKNDLYYMNNFNKFGFNFKTDSLELYTNDISLNELYEDFEKLQCSVNMFSSIAAIGDSYTAASCKNSQGIWKDMTAQSYIATIGKRAGVDWYNYGVGGSNTRTYQILENGLQKVLSDTPKDFYMLALGINDASLGEEYIGTIEDIKENYENNSDTFIGNYSKIIEQIKNHGIISKFVLVKIPLKGNIYSLYNNAIELLSNYYNIPTINPFDDEFFNSSLYNTKIDGHPTCLGYSSMGLAYERLLSKCFKSNYNYFLYSTIG